MIFKSNKENKHLNLNLAPQKPGVYFFLDSKKKLLYIGKATNLRARLRAYRPGISADPRIQRMVTLAKQLRWQETESDIEALILESQLVKKHQPQFNVMLRDDKRYFYVTFSKETFTKIGLTHQPQPEQKTIGPFTEGTAIKTTLRLLRRIFPYCTCKKPHARPCLNSHLGNCLSFCCLRVPATKEMVSLYTKNIHALEAILSGKKIALVKKLEREMQKLAKQGELETAIILRERLARLQRVFENAKVIKEISDRDATLRDLQKIFKLPTPPRRLEAYDISNIQGINAYGSMIVFIDGQPVKADYRLFKIRTKQSPDDTAMLSEVLTRRLKHSEWPLPDVFFIDGGKGQLNAVSAVVGPQHAILSIAKGKQEIFATTLSQPVPINQIPESVRNLLIHADDEAHRFAINAYRRKHRNRNLDYYQYE